MSKLVLGISAFYHDSAAALIRDGEIVAAAHEERFTRKKHDESFPVNSIDFVLSAANINLADLDLIAFYDKPFLKFERLIETYHCFAPRGIRSFLTSVPIWIKDKIFMKRNIMKELEKLSDKKLCHIPLLFSEHHLSHAASAFYPSAFSDAAILTVDGVGEWATTTIGKGKGNSITVMKELPFPHSLGLLYSSFTHYCGFKVNSGEYKLMGLAPYGQSGSDQVKLFKKLIKKRLVDIKTDGSLILQMEYFNFATGLSMCRDKKWEQLFGIARRESESELTQDYMNLALAIQEVTSEIIILLAKTAKKITGCKNLVMAGGVALNSVANGALLREKIFENIWIQPAAGDAGGALGAAYAGLYIYDGAERIVGNTDKMKGSLLGPKYSDSHIEELIDKYKAPSKKYVCFDELCSSVASKIADGSVVGWFQGRAEWGPRALGNRSIIADPRCPNMQKKLNLKIKKREGFRPFAPSVLSEKSQDYFDISQDSPYMLFVAPVRRELCVPSEKNDATSSMHERLYRKRSLYPSITHVDYSARLQSVHKETNPRYWQLINSFNQITASSVLINTSFNVRGEPIVCSPEDAYRCFMSTEMDYLAIGDFLFDKKDQPLFSTTDKFTLD